MRHLLLLLLLLVACGRPAPPDCVPPACPGTSACDDSCNCICIPDGF